MSTEQNKSRRPPAPECNLLWAASRGLCARPGCGRQLLKFDGGRWITLGEIAHIRAHSAEGPRYDPEWSSRADSYENCLILCRDDHRVVDNNPSAYPVETLLDWKHRHELPVTPGSQHALQHIAAPPPPARLAIVRDIVVSQVEGCLANGSRVGLLGLSGCGKTQVARHWFTSRATEYTFRWWVRGHDRETLMSDLASLAPLVGLPSIPGDGVESQAGAVRDELSRRGAWLLVVDDAGDPEQLLDLLPSTGGNMIVTSQDLSWSGTVPYVEVPPLTDAEALELLRLSPALDVATTEDLQALVAECRGHPLVVDQAASYIAKTGIDVAGYTKLLRTRRHEALDRTAAPNRPGFAESIRAALDRVGEDSREVLALLAQVAPGPFDITTMPLLEQSAESEESQDIPHWDPFRVEDALANLRAFSLVQRERTNLVAHELVTDVVRTGLSHGEQYLAIYRAFVLLIEQLPDRPSESFEWPTMERLLPHAVAALASASGLPDEFPGEAIARVLDRLAVYFNGRGDRERALTYFERGKAVLEDQGLTRSSMYGSLLHNLGNLHAEARDYVLAEDLQREALKVKERALGQDALIVGVSCGALGAVLEARGKLGEAARYHERAAAIYRDNNDHQWTSNALIDLAGIAAREHRTYEAARMFKEAIVEADMAGDAIPEAVTARLRLAEISAAEGEPVEAVRLSLTARRIAEDAEAPIQLAEALTAQGRYLIQMGLSSAGVAIYQRALDIWKEVLESHPIRYATTLGNLGFGLVQAERPQEGLEHLKESQRLLERLLPTDDETVAISRLLTGKAYLALLRPQEAMDAFRAVVRDGAAGVESTEEAREFLDRFEGALGR